MNKVYFIRHAPTKANLSGEMMEDYDLYDIESIDAFDWWNKVGKEIECNSLAVYTSPALRCISTAKSLFLLSEENMIKEPLLKELDCSSLGTKKFWEISREEFNEVCHPDMDAFKEQVNNLIDGLVSLNLDDGKAIVCVTHGLFIRHLFNHLTGKGDSELYDLINSATFSFRNLDMMECEIVGNTLRVNKVYRYEHR